MKLLRNLVSVLAFALVLSAYASAADAPKTVTGKASCGGCSGVVEKCSVMLTDKDGMRWILTGEESVLKAAFEARHDGKSMTAKLDGDPTTRTDKNGKEFKKVKVTEVKIDA